MKPNYRRKQIVKVTVSGAPGSGKTTIACILARLLSDVGIEFRMLDDDDGATQMIRNAGKQRVEEIQDNVAVLIDTHQISRTDMQREKFKKEWEQAVMDTVKAADAKRGVK